MPEPPSVEAVNLIVGEAETGVRPVGVRGVPGSVLSTRTLVTRALLRVVRQIRRDCANLVQAVRHERRSVLNVNPYDDGVDEEPMVV